MEFTNGLIWFRTEVLKEILLEYEKEILYWRGKEIARKENLSDYQKLQDFFHKMNLGKINYSSLEGQKHRVLMTDSPLIVQYRSAVEAISLECGIITGALQLIYKRDGEGVARWITDEQHEHPYIEVIVTLSSSD